MSGKLELAELRRLLREAITPPPWNVEAQKPTPLLDFLSPDADLAVAAVNQLPALLSAFEESLGLIADAADCLERYEDVQDGDEGRQVPNAAMSMRMSLDQFLARFPKEQA